MTSTTVAPGISASEPFSENWDDDFEFGAGRMSQDHQQKSSNKPNKMDPQTENWDDDFDDDPPPRAMPLSTPAQRRLRRKPSPENWDDSFEYSPPNTPPKPRAAPRDEPAAEFGEDDDDDDDDDEDRTVTRRPSSTRTTLQTRLVESPPPPVPALPSFLQPMDIHPMLDHDHLPPSPKQSLFSPSVLSHGSSGHDSTTHLFRTTSRGLAHLPPSPPIHKERERRRLRKKSRPPGASENIYELRPMSPPFPVSEDEDPPSNPEHPDSADSHPMAIPEHPVTPEPPPISSAAPSVPSTPAKDKDKESAGLLSRGIGSVKRRLGRAGKKRVSTTPSEAAVNENSEGIDPELDTILQSTPPHPISASPPQSDHKSWFFRSPSHAQQPSSSGVSCSPPAAGGARITQHPSSSVLADDTQPPASPPHTPGKLIKRKSFGFVPLRRGRGPINDVGLVDASPTNNTTNNERLGAGMGKAGEGSSSAESRSPSREPFPTASSEESAGAGGEGRKYGPLGLGWSPHRRKRSGSRGPGEHPSSDERTPRKRSRSKGAAKTRKESSSRGAAPTGDEKHAGGWIENVRRISLSSHHHPHLPTPGRHGRKDSGASLSGILGFGHHSHNGSPKKEKDTTGASKPGQIQASSSGSSSSSQPRPLSKRSKRQEASESSGLAQDADDEDDGEGDGDEDDVEHLRRRRVTDGLPPAPPALLAATAPREGLPPTSPSPSTTPKPQKTRPPPSPAPPLPSTPMNHSASEPAGISGGNLLNAPPNPAASSPGGSLGRNAGVGAGGGPAGTIKARRNSLGDLKIPARISQAQIGLRRDLGMVKEFKGVVDHLKELQKTYAELTKRIEEIIDACSIPPPPPPPPLPSSSSSSSRRKSGEGRRSRSGSRSITKSPTASASTSSLHLPLPNKLRKSLDQAPPPPPLPPQPSQPTTLSLSYTNLLNKYSLVWECAELLIELGAGPSGGGGTTASSRSTSGSGVGRDGRERAVTLSGGVDERGRSPSPSAALMFANSASGSGSQTPASGDLSARQLVLLKEILNPLHSASSTATTQSSSSHHQAIMATDRVLSHSSQVPNGAPNSSTLPSGAAPPVLDVNIDVDDVFGPGMFLSPGGGGLDFVNRDWRWGGTVMKEGAMGSTITLPSTTSESQGERDREDGGNDGSGAGRKKKRVSRLVGFRDMLRALRKGGAGKVVDTGGPVTTGGESSKGELDARGLPKERDRSGTGGRKRSKTSSGLPGPWDSVRSFSRPLSPYDTSTSSFKVPASTTMPGGKSPRRPSLASIFKIGSGSSKTGHVDAGGTSTNSNSTSEAEDEEEDWDRLDDISPQANSHNANSSSTIRGKSPYLQTSALPASSHLPTAAQLQQQMQQHPYQGSGGSSRSSLHQGSRTSLHMPIRGTKLSDVKELDLVGEEGRTPTKKAKYGAGPGSAGSDLPAPTELFPPAASTSMRPLSGILASSSMFKSKTGSVRSMPPPVRGGQGDLFQLAMTPENIRPLLENAREVSKRLGECVEEIKRLLGGVASTGR